MMYSQPTLRVQYAYWHLPSFSNTFIICICIMTMVTILPGKMLWACWLLDNTSGNLKWSPSIILGNMGILIDFYLVQQVIHWRGLGHNKRCMKGNSPRSASFARHWSHVIHAYYNRWAHKQSIRTYARLLDQRNSHWRSKCARCYIITCPFLRIAMCYVLLDQMILDFLPWWLRVCVCMCTSDQHIVACSKRWFTLLDLRRALIKVVVLSSPVFTFIRSFPIVLCDGYLPLWE